MAPFSYLLRHFVCYSAILLSLQDLCSSCLSWRYLWLCLPNLQTIWKCICSKFSESNNVDCFLQAFFKSFIFLDALLRYLLCQKFLSVQMDYVFFNLSFWTYLPTFASNNMGFRIPNEQQFLNMLNMLLFRLASSKLIWNSFTSCSLSIAPSLPPPSLHLSLPNLSFFLHTLYPYPLLSHLPIYLSKALSIYLSTQNLSPAYQPSAASGCKVKIRQNLEKSQTSDTNPPALPPATI